MYGRTQRHPLAPALRLDLNKSHVPQAGMKMDGELTGIDGGSVMNLLKCFLFVGSVSQIFGLAGLDGALGNWEEESD